MKDSIDASLSIDSCCPHPDSLLQGEEEPAGLDLKFV